MLELKTSLGERERQYDHLSHKSYRPAGRGRPTGNPCCQRSNRAGLLSLLEHRRDAAARPKDRLESGPRQSRAEFARRRKFSISKTQSTKTICSVSTISISAAFRLDSCRSTGSAWVLIRTRSKKGGWSSTGMKCAMQFRPSATMSKACRSRTSSCRSTSPWTARREAGTTSSPRPGATAVGFRLWPQPWRLYRLSRA